MIEVVLQRVEVEVATDQKTGEKALLMTDPDSKTRYVLPLPALAAQAIGRELGTDIVVPGMAAMAETG